MATVTIVGQNDAPVALAIAQDANEDGPSVTLTADYTDVDLGDTHAFSVDATGTLGSVVSNGDGTFTYKIGRASCRERAGATAADTFSYTVTDNNGLSSTRTATVTIHGQNDAPVALAIAQDANEDGPSVTLTADYTDVDLGDTHAFSVDATGTLGSVVSNGDGTFTY